MVNKLKTEIKKANVAYRTGDSIISDEEYDILLDKLEKALPKKEFELFQNTLTEPSGKVKHNFVIGSLNKIKSEEADELKKFIVKNTINSMFITEKLDGCSIVCKYYLGELVQACTRGDGYFGVDITEKAKLMSDIPNKILVIDEIEVRGEILICGDDYKNFGFKNRRNSVAGILNEDVINKDKLNLLSVKFYQVLTSEKHILRQYADLMSWGFKTPKYTLLDYSHVVPEYLPVLLKKWREEADYDMDGLVISSNVWTNENNVYKPEARIAYKVNSEGVETTITGVEWTQAKLGSFIPVFELEPTEMDGVTVSRVHALNAKYVKDNNLGAGSKIKIILSGSIIPKVVDIVEANGCFIPSTCSSCGSKLVWQGVDIKCDNEDCNSSKYKTMKSFVVKLGIEKVSDATLENLGIDSIEKLLAFTPDTKYKAQVSFYREINEKLFSKTPVEIFSCMSFNGAGGRNIERILDHYFQNDEEHTLKELVAMDRMFIQDSFNEYPTGMGKKIFDKIAPYWIKNLNLLKIVMNDSRWLLKEKANFTKKETKTMTSQKTKLTGKTFCITGTLSQPRKHFEELIEANGGKNAAISKSLNYLICGDKAGSKEAKAKSFGVTILTEKEFMELIA